MDINAEKLKYLGITAIYINEAFNEEEESKIKDILFSFNEVKQIYFTDKANYQTIEKVKYFLDISSYIEDEKIEKIIYSKLDDEELKSLLSLSIKNPSTWTIAYDKHKNTIYTTELPRFRSLYSYLSKVRASLEGLNEKEKFKVLSEELKDFKRIDESHNLIEVLERQELGPGDYERTLSKLLRDNDIASYIGKSSKGLIMLIKLEGDIYTFDANTAELSSFKAFSGEYLSPLKFLEEKNKEQALRKYNIYLEQNEDDLEESLDIIFADLYQKVASQD